IEVQRGDRGTATLGDLANTQVSRVPRDVTHALLFAGRIRVRGRATSRPKEYFRSRADRLRSLSTSRNRVGATMLFMTDRLIRTVHGRTPRLDDTAWTAPGTVLTGDVRLHAGASIWYNTVLRADDEFIEIGEDSNIQDGCVAHTDAGFPTVIGDRVSVGHRAVLHG